MSRPQSEIGLIGLAVMGENIALNIESKGFPISVFNRTTSKVDDFINDRGQGKKFFGAHTVEEFVGSLKKPRKIIMLAKAGNAVDELIEHLLPLLEKGDVLIDGGLLFSKAEVQAFNEIARECGEKPWDLASFKTATVREAKSAAAGVF
jgi:6-phosphogluconate dehydrogenase